MMTTTSTPDNGPESPTAGEGDDLTRPRRRAMVRALQGFVVPLVVAGVLTAGAPGLGTYKVKNGDTLSQIAQRYGTTVRTLVALNHLPGNGDAIYVGETLRIPRRATPQTTSSRRYLRYIVKRGETVSSIAHRYHVTQRVLLTANGLRLTDRIYAGRPLRVPVKRQASPGSAFAGRTYPAAVVAAAARNRAALQHLRQPTRAQVRSLISATARRRHVDPELALAVAWQESGWRQRVVSPANAVGVMQVIPSTGRFTSRLVGRRLNLLRTADNVTAGVVLLDQLTSAARLDVAVAAYYQGLGGVTKNGMYADTKVYVRSVLATKARLEHGWNPLR